MSGGGPCVRRAAGFVARRIAGELVVVPVLRSEAASGASLPFFVLNESAEALWDVLVVPHSPDELVRLLTLQWEVSADRAREDVTAFLAELRVLGAVEDTICPGT